jgi:phosphoribosylamine--glycine ligase
MHQGVKVLVVGGGGREHTLVSTLARSRWRPKLYAAPGNAGIAAEAEIVPISADSPEGIARLVELARVEGIELTVVGPELPLVLGIADRFQEAGLRVVGPSAAAARLEGSKSFAKEFLKRRGIPSADFQVFSDPEEARRHLESRSMPAVVKADGLAAGKGVIVARERDEALRAVERILVERCFGDAGAQVVVEDFLEGREMSLMVLSDGVEFIPLETALDYKAAFDGDQGPNTGGMGSYSPCLALGSPLVQRILRSVIRPTLDGMQAEGAPFRGFLYAGLMLTQVGPRVLEFNVRLGDPETQVILSRLRSDLVDLLFDAVSEGGLAQRYLVWDPRPAVCVVATSGGYPGDYAKGLAIAGLDEAEGDSEDIKVYHAGTARSPEGNVVTSGGRVLGVTALGADVEEARASAYDAMAKLHFDGIRYRTDIALSPAGSEPTPTPQPAAQSPQPAADEALVIEEGGDLGP